jgi:hypothetical protein
VLRRERELDGEGHVERMLAREVARVQNPSFYSFLYYPYPPSTFN